MTDPTDDASTLRSIRLLLDPRGHGIGWDNTRTVEELRRLLADRDLDRDELSDLHREIGPSDVLRPGVRWFSVVAVQMLKERVVELEARIAQLDPPRGPCGMRYHAKDCPCDGSAGDR